jgi:recombinational DNA repair ATPase RecF
MLIERLQLFRFRNLTEIEFIPDPRLNFFLGSNGQGKTSVLEALSLLASLRSFRETRAQNWIQDQTLTSELRASIVPSQETPDWRSHLKLSFERETLNSPVRKRLFINQKSIPSIQPKRSLSDPW